MGMTIDEIIKTEQEIAEEFQRTVDTHMVSEDMSLEEMYCDDTEVIEEKLKRCKELSDYHSTIANTMKKYQQIQEIIRWNDAPSPYYKPDGQLFREICEVLEDGSENNHHASNS